MSDGEAGAQSSVRSPASPPGAKLARAHTYPVAQRSSPGRGKGRGRGKGALAAAGAPGPRGRKATSCHRWTSEEELRLRQIVGAKGGVHIGAADLLGTGRSDKAARLPAPNTKKPSHETVARNRRTHTGEAALGAHGEAAAGGPGQPVARGARDAGLRRRRASGRRPRGEREPARARGRRRDAMRRSIVPGETRADASPRDARARRSV